MAHLVRIHQVRYVLDGTRVPTGTKGAKKVKEKSAKWYGAGIPGQGKRRVPLATNKEAAQRMLDTLVRDAERGEAKMLDRSAAARSLTDHLDHFREELALGVQSATGRRRRSPPSAFQVGVVVQRVRDVLAGCGLRWVDDLKSGTAADKLSRYLRGRLAGTVEGARKLSAQSAHFFLFEARRFVKWIARKGTGVPADLFDGIAGFDPTNNRVHARRDVSPEELGRLLAATKDSPLSYFQLPGPDRHHLYLTAFATGFRASELASLTPEHFHLAEDPPAVSLAGRVAKNRRGVKQPLPPAVAVALRVYLADKPAGIPVWPGSWKVKGRSAKMLRRDLAAAGVPYAVEGVNGKEYADFHALRHTFCSALAAAGTAPKELQTLARHQDPRLTLGLYTHARSAELVRAVGRLQIPGAAPASPLAALDREQLEGVTLALLILLGALLVPAGTAPTRVAPVALRVALAAGTSGDPGAPVGARDRKRRRRAAA